MGEFSSLRAIDRVPETTGQSVALPEASLSNVMSPATNFSGCPQILRLKNKIAFSKNNYFKLTNLNI